MLARRPAVEARRRPHGRARSRPARDPAAEEAAHHRALVEAAHALYDAGPWDGARLGATNFVTSVLSAPCGPRTRDGGEASVRLGYLRHGARVPVIPDAIVNESCPDGWFELVQGGLHLREERDARPEEPARPPRAARPRPDRVAPVRVRREPRERHAALPARAVARRPKEVRALALPRRSRPPRRRRSERRRRGRRGAPTPCPAPSARRAPVADAPDAAATPWYLRDGGSKEVTLEELHGHGVLVRRMVRGFVLALDRDFKAAHAHWWRNTVGLRDPVRARRHPLPAGRVPRRVARRAPEPVARAIRSATPESRSPSTDRTRRVPRRSRPRSASSARAAAHALVDRSGEEESRVGRAAREAQRRRADGRDVRRQRRDLPQRRRAARGSRCTTFSSPRPSAPPSDLGARREVDRRGPHAPDPRRVRRDAPGLRDARLVRASATRRTRRRTTPPRPARSASSAKHVSATMDGDVAADAPVLDRGRPLGHVLRRELRAARRLLALELRPPDEPRLREPLAGRRARSSSAGPIRSSPTGWHGVFANNPDGGDADRHP